MTYPEVEPKRKATNQKEYLTRSVIDRHNVEDTKKIKKKLQ